jgi:hypothetical protein
MGVIDLYFVDNEVEVHCRQKVVDCACIGRQPTCPLSLSAPPVLLVLELLELWAVI